MPRFLPVYEANYVKSNEYNPVSRLFSKIINIINYGCPSEFLFGIFSEGNFVNKGMYANLTYFQSTTKNSRKASREL